MLGWSHAYLKSTRFSENNLLSHVHGVGLHAILHLATYQFEGIHATANINLIVKEKRKTNNVRRADEISLFLVKPRHVSVT